MHYYLKEKELVRCENCGKEKLPHIVCSFCGFYKGKKILEIKEKEKKKD
jgi:large subunit ribosomal protein L32